MKTQLRHLVADALYPTKAYSLPAVCERYGMDPGDSDEAFSSKTRYVMRRLEKLSDEKVFGVAKNVVRDFPDDKLQAPIELLEKDGHLVTDLTRHHLAEALHEFSMAGKRDLLELLRKHFPSIDHEPSPSRPFEKLADDIHKHAIHNDDWQNAEILERVGFLTCSQSKLFQFLEDLLHPIRRDQEEQTGFVAKLNPILRRDVLISFDQSGVHHAWKKALDRRATDPEGAITAAKTLLETVCKHIIDEAGKTYGENDDLPKLYSTAAECLNLAPNQQTETMFKSILGNCQSIVGNLAGLRNRLGDSHGQGKGNVKPLARHAELAVNLPGSMATFLVSTWNAERSQH